MSKELDYFKIVPQEILDKILTYLSPLERLPLEAVGDRRLRQTVTSLVVDSSTICQKIKIENDLFKLSKYHNLSKFVIPKFSGTWDRKKLASFAQSLALSASEISSFVITIEGLPIVSNYIHFLHGHNCIKSLTLKVLKSPDSGTWKQMAAVVKQTSKLNSFAIESTSEKVGQSTSKNELFIKFVKILSKYQIVTLKLIEVHPTVSDMLLNNLQNVQKLTMDRLKGQRPGQVVKKFPNLEFLAITDHCNVPLATIGNLANLECLKVLILAMDSVPSEIEVRTLVRSLPGGLEVLMLSFTSFLAADVLSELPAKVSRLKELTLNCSFDRKLCLSTQANTIRDIVCNLRHLEKLNLLMDGFWQKMDERSLRSRLPKLRTLTFDSFRSCRESPFWDNSIENKWLKMAQEYEDKFVL